MPGLLAIEWAGDALRGLDADVSRGSIHIRQSFHLPWPEDPETKQDSQLAGEWLRGEFDRLNVRSRRVLITLPREDVVMRPLQLPEAADAVLADLVRCQASARLAVPLDQVVVDYLPVRTTTATSGRVVLMAAAPKRLLKEIQACFEVAGYELASVGVTALSCCETVARVEQQRGYNADQASLVISVVGQRLEISFRHSGDVLFTHGVRFGSRRESVAVSAEVQRALVAHESVLGDVEIARAWLIGGMEQSQAADGLDFEIHALDPLSELSPDVRAENAIGQPAEFVGPLGSLLGSTDSTKETIEFLNPRAPIIKPKRTKLVAGILAALLCLSLAGAYGGLRMHLDSLRSRIVEGRRQQQELEAVLEEGEPVLELAGLLDRWETRHADWLDHMQRIGETMPGAEQFLVERWRFDTAQGEVRGRIHVDGTARERKDVEITNQRLADQTDFRIRPTAMRPSRGDSAYPLRFEIDIDLLAPTMSLETQSFAESE